MGFLARQLRDFISVITQGLRCLLQNFPSLLAVFLAGYTARMAALWAAGKVAGYSTALAALLLPLAPLSLIIALVLMLRIAARSFGDVLQGEDDFSRSAMQIIVVVLPFLAIYASNGFLKQDMRRYIQDQTGVAWQQVAAGDFSASVFDRAGLPVTGLLLAVVVIVLLMRKLIVWKELGAKTFAWATLAAYLEALWMMSAGLIFADYVDTAKTWLFTRRGVEEVIYWWNEAQGFYGTFFIKPFKYVASLISPFTALIVVPVAWLAVGATIYGASLRKGEPIVNPQLMNQRIERIPGPVRRTVSHVVEPAVTPVRAATTAISKIAVAGVVPMVLFCLIFALTGWVRIGVREAFRAVIGPQTETLVFALEPYAALLDSTAYFLLVVPLLASAVSRVIAGQKAVAQA